MIANKKITNKNLAGWLDVETWDLPISIRSKQLLKIMEVQTLSDLKNYDSADLNRYNLTSQPVKEVMVLIGLVDTFYKGEHFSEHV